jgi:hypothetical protein
VQLAACWASSGDDETSATAQKTSASHFERMAISR